MTNNTLHLLRQSPFDQNDIQLCLNNMTKNDAVVLMDDGCYILNHNSHQLLVKSDCTIYVIASHASARGLSINEEFQSIDLKRLNELIFTHNNSVTW